MLHATSSNKKERFTAQIKVAFPTRALNMSTPFDGGPSDKICAYADIRARTWWNQIWTWIHFFPHTLYFPLKQNIWSFILPLTKWTKEQCTNYTDRIFGTRVHHCKYTKDDNNRNIQIKKQLSINSFSCWPGSVYRLFSLASQIWDVGLSSFPISLNNYFGSCCNKMLRILLHHGPLENLTGWLTI